MKNKTYLVVAILLLFFTISLVFATDWPMFQQNVNHTGYTLDDGPLNGTVKWIFETNGSVTYGSPMVVDGRVYITSKYQAGTKYDLYSLYTTNGSLIWYRTFGWDGTNPTIVNDIIYIGCYDGYFYSIYVENSSTIWQYDVSNYTYGYGSPTIVNDIVYFGSYDFHIYALNATNGSQIWNYTTGSHIRSSPAVVNDIMYIGSVDGNVYALNATNGSLIWGEPIDILQFGVISSPTYKDDRIFIGGKHFYALNATNGSKIWKYSIAGTGIMADTAAVLDNIVYMGDVNGGNTLRAFYVNNGTLLWSFPTGSYVYPSPIISANGFIYIGSYSKNVYAVYTTNGSEFWRRNTGNLIGSTPAISNGELFIGSNDGNLYSFGEDSFYPKFSNAQTNITITEGTLNLSIDVQEYNGLSTAYFTINNTNYSFTGNSTEEWWDTTQWWYLWHCSVNDYYSWTDFYGVDPTGHWNMTSDHNLPINFICDVDPPKYSANSTNITTIDVIDSIEHRVYWTDNYNLSGFIFSWNGTGSWTNDSFIEVEGSGNWSNTSTYINRDQEGAMIGWQVYANDTVNNLNVTDTFLYTIIQTDPVIGAKYSNLTSVQPNNIICLNISQVNDTGIGVDTVWTTIQYPNNTLLNVTMSDTGSCAGIADDGWYSVDTIVGSDDGTFYFYFTWVNDSLSNVNSNITSLSIIVATPVTPGGGGGGGSILIPFTNFTINKDLIKVIVKQGESVRETLTITNTGNTELNMTLQPTMIEKFLAMSEDEFSLLPGKAKTINIDVFAREIEMPNVFTGRIYVKGDSLTEIVNVIIEVKERKPLFDIRTKLFERNLNPGDELEADIIVYNLGDLREIDVTLYYALKDFEDNVILFEEESLAINKDFTVTRTLDIPLDILLDEYVFYARVSYEDVIATAASPVFITDKKIFEIPYTFIIPILLLVIIITLLMALSKKGLEKEQIGFILHQGEGIRKPLRIKNTGSKIYKVKIHLGHLERFLKFSEKSFYLRPEETKIVYMDVTASKYEKPGDYKGKVMIIGGKIKEEIDLNIHVKEEYYPTRGYKHVKKKKLKKKHKKRKKK